MESVDITLPSSGSTVSVALDRKQMKTCRLKVYPEQTIVLSLPVNAPTEWAEKFLNEKSTWIEAKLQLFQKTVGYAATNEIKNGYSIKMLGEDMIFALAACERDHVYAERKIIHICVKQPSDQNRVRTLFEKWWRNQAKDVLEHRVNYWYPVIAKYGIEKPHIAIRKMRTLWGSCSVPRNTVTFNFYLIKARMPYIDYVVLHELIHFLYPNHSKLFYDFLSNHMPDWKERKRFLDQDVVHGL